MTPSAPLPLPARGLIFAIILALLVLAAWVLVFAFPQENTADIERIPGTQDVQASWLPREKTPAKLTIEQVAALDNAGAFIPIPPPETVNVRCRFPHEERWHRLRLKNTARTEKRVVLDLIWTIYDVADLYQLRPDGGWDVSRAGVCVSPSDPQKSPRWKAFPLVIPPEQTVTVYLHTRDYFRLPTQFLLWSNSEDYIREEKFRDVKYAGYLCLWTGAVLFGFFRYAILRQRDDLHYAMFALLFGAIRFLSSGFTGISVQWPEWPLGEMIVGVAGFLAVAHLCLFARHFLDTPRFTPGLDRWFRRLQCFWWFCPATLPIVFWPSFGLAYIQVTYVFLAVTLGILLYASVRCWRAGSRPAPFFLLGFSPYLLSVIWVAFYAQDTMSRIDNRPSLIGNTLTLAFLSFASAYRHRLVLEENFNLQSNYTLDLESQVTERTQSLKDLSSRLSAAVSQRDRILTIIGHDLRGPAISLKSLTSIVINDDSLTREELVEWATQIDQECALQLDLLNNLLIWGSMQSSRWHASSSNLRVAEKVTSVWEALRNTATAKQIEFNSFVTPNLAVHADARLLSTVLRNLLTNAVKFTRPGGEIEVGASPAQNNMVEIWVKDNGVGIPANRLKRLFSSVLESTQGTGAEKGIGIGLNLCQDLIQTAGGNIRVESIPGRGATVFFTLPAAAVGRQGAIQSVPTGRKWLLSVESSVSK